MGNIYCISNHKGGVGKTTSTINIGAALCILKKRVLLIDLDPQANLTQSLGIEEQERQVYGALKGDYPLTPLLVSEGLYIIPSTIDLSAAEIELSQEPGREYILSELTKVLKKDFDFILIDCPPSLGLLTVNALTAADKVFIPLQSEFLAVQGLTRLLEIIDKIKKRLNKNISLGGVFLTQFDSRKTLNKDVSEAIDKQFNGKVLNTRIRDNVALAEAPARGMDIFRYSPKSFGAEDYLSLSKEILKLN